MYVRDLMFITDIPWDEVVHAIEIGLEVKFDEALLADDQSVISPRYRKD